MFDKRIINEYESLINIESNIDYCPIHDVNILSYTKKNVTIEIKMSIFSYTHTITFYLCDSFPFKPPSIQINTKQYKNLLIDHNKRHLKKYYYDKFFFNGDYDMCLCCSTILCNWSPSFKLVDILPEIKKNIEYTHRFIEILHAIKIKNKYLIDDICIESYL